MTPVQVLLDPASGEVDLSGTADDYHALAALLTAGGGTLPAEPDAVDAFGRTALSRIQVSTAPDRPVLISVDADGVLRISGAAASRAVLASNVAAMAAAEDGGHLHVEHFPDHPYLAEGSASLIINSPHGGMPLR
ncbi:Imm32 family immunity protein [Micromonospora auratinigra]|uniref:Uncharacterized protein n=1 Tax=Micromonospora auratinigra TaxID=261654 RepID=A0A1A8ZNP2_9ACTN|nr:hypothetical protein [Micromonospora auratinigra]SBT45437.1 hypothetical protein GA0070611_3032 [Micromonospora auratinigra]